MPRAVLSFKKNVVLLPLFFCLVGGAFASSRAKADEPDKIIVHGPDSPRDKRFHYYQDVLIAALERTTQKYGKYTWTALEPASHLRKMNDMEKGRATIAIQVASEDLDKRFLPVRLPLDRGVLGYRVFIIRKNDASKFAAVRTIEDLSRFKVGQGTGWSDVSVWKASGFKVVEGTSYDGLFHMLEAGRFDFISQAPSEALVDLELSKDGLPGLTVEKTLLVYYPWPRYVYCRDTPEGKRLAARLTEGLEAILTNPAEYGPLFEKHFGESLRLLDLPSRRKFIIANPVLPKNTPIERKELWYVPSETSPKQAAPRDGTSS